MLCTAAQQTAVAQATVEIPGGVIDSSSKLAVADATVLLLKAADSSLICFARTGSDGRFVFRRPVGETDLLIINHTAYLEYARFLYVCKDLPIPVLTIKLFPRSAILEPAYVSATRPLFKTMKDTLEFNASEMKAPKSANVEQVLKQLPGVEVNDNGEIFVNGEKVKRLFIDGVEFFGDNPAITTQTLSAAAIDKIQFINKKSRKAELTGIDDDKSFRVVNLTLRETAKNHLFGKFDLGSDEQAHYDGTAIGGQFDNRQKTAGFGIASNVGQGMLKAMDARDFEGGDDVGVDPVPAGADNFGVGGATGGTPAIWNAGAHYSTTMQGPRQLNAGQLIGNMRIMSFSNSPVSSTYTRTTLPDSLVERNNRTVSNISNVQYLGTLSIDGKFKHNTTTRLSVAAFSESVHSLDRFQDTTRINGKLVNSSYRVTDGNISNATILAKLSLTKKLRAPTNTLSSFLTVVNGMHRSTGILSARTNTFGSDSLGHPLDSLDQRKDNQNNQLSVAGNMLFFSQVSDRVTFSAAADVVFKRNESLQNALGKDGGVYDVKIDSLSSNNIFYSITKSVSFDGQYKAKWATLTAGADLGQIVLKSDDKGLKVNLSHAFGLYAPHVSFTAEIDQAHTLTLHYNGNLIQPELFEILPVKNNNDPLNIVIGNPNLKPAFNHIIRASFSGDRPRSQLHWAGDLNVGFTANAISRNSSIDSTGSSVVRFVNVSGNQSAGVGGTVIKSAHHLQVSCRLTASYDRSTTFVNNSLDKSDSYLLTSSLSIRTPLSENVRLLFRTAEDFLTNTNSINSTVKTATWDIHNEAQLNAAFLKTLEAQMIVHHSIQKGADPNVHALNTVVCDVWLLKTFLKGNLTTRLSLNDIFNQRSGISRSTVINQYTETRFSPLRRYWLLSVIWVLNNRNKAK